MTKPLATYPDTEEVVIDLLTSLLAPWEPGVTVGLGVPADWQPSSEPHAEVQSHGVPRLDHPVVAYVTVRVALRAATTERAKALAWLCHGLLLSQPGYSALTGVLAARDTQTRAELASFTVRATVRSEPPQHHRS